MLTHNGVSRNKKYDNVNKKIYMNIFNPVWTALPPNLGTDHYFIGGGGYLFS